MDCSTPGFPVHHQLLELAQTYVHWVGDAIQQSYPLSFPSPHAFNLSQHQGLFQWVSSSHQVVKVLDSFSISPSNEYSGLISFRMDWFDLLAVQRTLKSLLQHHNSKASILWRSALSPCLFFTSPYLFNLIKHIQKQRHYFANKGLSSQGYGFSSGQVWMWKLDCKESWVLKNWCFWTVVLEKTFESPLDCKEVQPVHPRGDQSWVFLGGTDAKAETPVLWPPHAKSWLIAKDSDAGRD